MLNLLGLQEDMYIAILAFQSDWSHDTANAVWTSMRLLDDALKWMLPVE